MPLGLNQELLKAGSQNLSQIVTSLAKNVKRFVVDEVKIRQATDNYASAYLNRYGSIKILGMREPTSLLDLYTDVEIVDSTYRIKAHTIEHLEQEFRDLRKHRFSHQRQYGIHVANTKNRLNVLGAPGSGKSTFLKNIGLECLTHYAYPGKDKYEHKCFPVLIELKRFRTEQINIKSLIQSELEIAGFPKSDTLLERLLEEGSMLILLDGLDEVPESNLSFVLEHINDFADQYKKNRFVSSCRTAHYKNFLKGFTDIEISEFSDPQIIKFTNNWFSGEEDLNNKTAERLQKQLFNETNSATLELARTPLLLAFICMTYDDSQRFPTNRASLYRQALMILMQRWAAEKRLHNDDIYQKFSIEVETDMLAEIAASYFKEDKILFREEEIRRKIQTYLEERPQQSQIDIDKVVSAVEKQQGLLVQRSYDIYSFSHLTIQEYLAAYHFKSPLQIESLIKNHLFEKRWREVFLLLSGMNDSNDLLLLMNDHLIRYATDQSIITETTNWIATFPMEEKSHKNAAVNRLFLVSLIIRFRRYEGMVKDSDRMEYYTDTLVNMIDSAYYDFFLHDLSHNLTKHTSELILDELAKIHATKDFKDIKIIIKGFSPSRPLSTMQPGTRNVYRKEIRKQIYDSINMPESLYSKRSQIYKPILSYVEAYTLILECAASSETIKQQTLETIYQSIFQAVQVRK